MFKKLVVVDAKGHLLGRLASYIAKTLLSGRPSIMQGKELQLSELRVLTSLAPFSETRLNLPNSWGKDSWPTPAELSYTTVLPPESSGEPSGECSLTSPPEELRHSAGLKSLRAFPLPTTPRRERWCPMLWELSSFPVSESSALWAIFQARLAGESATWLASWRTSADREQLHGTRRDSPVPTVLEKPWTWRRLMLLRPN